MSRCCGAYEKDVSSEMNPVLTEKADRPRHDIHSLSLYMTKFALIQVKPIKLNLQLSHQSLFLSLTLMFSTTLSSLPIIAVLWQLLMAPIMPTPLQGVLAMLAVFVLGQFAPSIFTTDPMIRAHLHALIPHLAWQQLLVSVTLFAESMAAGGKKFKLLAVGSAISTFISMTIIRGAESIVGIWSQGIVALFIGRLITAILGVLDLNGVFDPICRSISAYWAKRTKWMSGSF